MKSKTHLVLDLETLSTEKNALILSLGYAIVKQGDIVQFGEHRLSMEEQRCRDISHDTVMWWMAGDKAAAQGHLSSLPEVKCNVAMEALTNNICVHDEWKNVLVWGNSPNFDCDILGSYLKEVGGYKTTPWRFYNERDMRTLRDVAQLERHVPKIAHSAMYDAYAEAEDLCSYLKAL